MISSNLPSDTEDPGVGDQPRSQVSQQRSGSLANAARFFDRTTAKVMAAIAIAVIGGFDLLYRLGAPDWATDEVTYKNAGWDSFHGRPLANYETPPLGKHIIGLFEVVLGRSAIPVRLSAVAAAIVTGVLLALVARRAAGAWGALAAAFVWFALPHPEHFKLERFALLDIYMAMFTTAAILFALLWSDTRRSRWIVASGAAIGFAAACKQPGALVLIPIVGLVLARGRITVRSLLQVSALVGASIAAFVLAYFPAFGQMPNQVGHMVTVQAQQRSQGHPVAVGGNIYLHPPWWTFLRWQWDAGWVLTLCLAVVLVWALVQTFRRNVTVALLLAAVATNVVFFAFISRKELHHYPYAWAPALAAIVGLALCDLARRSGLARIGASIIALVLVVTAAQLVDRTARIRPTDYAATAALLRTTQGSRLRIVVIGYANVLAEYLPESLLVSDAATGSVHAVVVDPEVTHRLRGWMSLYLAAHKNKFELHKVGRLLVYLPKASS